MDYINVSILKNPLNWVTVFLMLTIFGIFAHVVLSHYQTISGDFSVRGQAAQAGAALASS